MTYNLHQGATLHKPEKRRQYDCDLEKQLMVDNLRAAVEIYGKDHMRKEFKLRKK